MSDTRWARMNWNLALYECLKECNTIFSTSKTIEIYMIFDKCDPRPQKVT